VQFTDVCGREEAGVESVLRATRITLGLLARRIGQLSEQIRNVDARLVRLVERHAPQPLEVVGIGPDTAVALLITVGDNPDRLDSEASFAALCGVSPVERSSGRWQFRRLNGGGDRQANAALHRIVFTRLRVDPRTQDYYERRIKDGKTRREIVRCLKRYAAREVSNSHNQPPLIGAVVTDEDPRRLAPAGYCVDADLIRRRPAGIPAGRRRVVGHGGLGLALEAPLYSGSPLSSTRKRGGDDAGGPTYR
jgi:hypothetical protein